MDKQTQVALNSALDKLLGNLAVWANFPDLRTCYAEFESLSSVLSKHEPWRTHLGIFDLIEVVGSLAAKHAKTEQGTDPVRVRDVLSAEDFKGFSSDVKSFLLSLPRRYECWIELPAMPSWGAGEIPLTKTLALVEKATVEKPPRDSVARALQDLPPPRPAVQLRVLASGYAGPRLDTTAIEDAVSQVKQFFHLFRRSGIYEARSQSILASMLGPTDLRCVVRDSSTPTVRMNVTLPERLKRFLSVASINEAKLQTYDLSKGLLFSDPKPASTREEKAQCVLDKIGWIAGLLDCPTDDWPDAHRIKTAAEWCFDSTENDNQTLGFIQACIGLEAMLGDDEQDEPLVTRLADRCAYLLGKSHRDREGIRRAFRAMYKVRSKLVHGRSPRLNVYDAQQLGFAQTTLEEVITEEGSRLLRALKETADQSSKAR